MNGESPKKRCEGGDEHVLVSSDWTVLTNGGKVMSVKLIAVKTHCSLFSQMLCALSQNLIQKWKV